MSQLELTEMKAAMFGIDDIALIKLAQPADDVPVLAINRERAETNREFFLYGKGAFGSGLTGEERGSNPERLLRRAQNRVDAVHERWLEYTFDRDVNALPAEGFQGRGDSGAPLIVVANGQSALIGLVSWRWNGTKDLKGPGYGFTGFPVRISSYAEWIDRVVTEDQAEPRIR